ncbi:MAG: hypothetical protein R2681_12965 [Pyrinomonadaceae bacterium]
MPKNELIELLQEEFDGLLPENFSRASVSFSSRKKRLRGFEHLEIIEDEYHLVVTGTRTRALTEITKSKDEVLYWMVSSLA